MLKLGSSNKTKLKEYQSMFPELDAVNIPDLPEIKASKDLVILYKVKELNQDHIILEDTILEILENNLWTEVVDIKWKVGQLKNKAPARWVVSLGIKDGAVIKIYRGTVSGKINPDLFVPDTFGFDSIFFPDGDSRTLLELNTLGLKPNFSARKRALDDLKLNKLYLAREINDLPPWTGEFQSKN